MGPNSQTDGAVFERDVEDLFGDHEQEGEVDDTKEQEEDESEQ